MVGKTDLNLPFLYFYFNGNQNKFSISLNNDTCEDDHDVSRLHAQQDNVAWEYLDDSPSMAQETMPIPMMG